MKYQKPEIVSVYTPTAVIQGTKDAMHVDSINPHNPLSTTAGYSVDE